jgi:hypothetical protein
MKTDASDPCARRLSAVWLPAQNATRYADSHIRCGPLLFEWQNVHDQAPPHLTLFHPRAPLPYSTPQHQRPSPSSRIIVTASALFCGHLFFSRTYSHTSAREDGPSAVPPLHLVIIRDARARCFHRARRFPDITPATSRPSARRHHLRLRLFGPRLRRYQGNGLAAAPYCSVHPPVSAMWKDVHQALKHGDPRTAAHR